MMRAVPGILDRIIGALRNKVPPETGDLGARLQEVVDDEVFDPKARQRLLRMADDLAARQR